jgi:hypothetical protein
MGGDRADFAEHNWKWNWPAELLGQITGLNLVLESLAWIWKLPAVPATWPKHR